MFSSPICVSCSTLSVFFSAGHKEESPMQDSQGPLVLSPERGDAPQASSVELSPSNSSGGTYMWDEEGFEPLGGPGTHQLDSYDDSELNSMVSFLVFEIKENKEKQIHKIQ